MSTAIMDIKYQTSNISQALLRNINDNFQSVSFDLLENGDIWVKVVLLKRTGFENDYIDDLIAEFSFLQHPERVIKTIVEMGEDYHPLQYLVYKKA